MKFRYCWYLLFFLIQSLLFSEKKIDNFQHWLKDFPFPVLLKEKAILSLENMVVLNIDQNSSEYFCVKFLNVVEQSFNPIGYSSDRLQSKFYVNKSCMSQFDEIHFSRKESGYFLKTPFQQSLYEALFMKLAFEEWKDQMESWPILNGSEKDFIEEMPFESRPRWILAQWLVHSFAYLSEPNYSVTHNRSFRHLKTVFFKNKTYFPIRLEIDKKNDFQLLESYIHDMQSRCGNEQPKLSLLIVSPRGVAGFLGHSLLRVHHCSKSGLMPENDLVFSYGALVGLGKTESELTLSGLFHFLPMSLFYQSYFFAKLQYEKIEDRIIKEYPIDEKKIDVRLVLKNLVSDYRRYSDENFFEAYQIFSNNCTTKIHENLFKFNNKWNLSQHIPVMYPDLLLKQEFLKK